MGKYTSHMDSYGICHSRFLRSKKRPSLFRPRACASATAMWRPSIRGTFLDPRNATIKGLHMQRNHPDFFSKMIGSAAKRLYCQMKKVSIHKVCTESEFKTITIIDICYKQTNKKNTCLLLINRNLHVNNKNPTLQTSQRVRSTSAMFCRKKKSPAGS